MDTRFRSRETNGLRLRFVSLFVRPPNLKKDLHRAQTSLGTLDRHCTVSTRRSIGHRDCRQEYGNHPCRARAGKIFLRHIIAIPRAFGDIDGLVDTKSVFTLSSARLGRQRCGSNNTIACLSEISNKSLPSARAGSRRAGNAMPSKRTQLTPLARSLQTNAISCRVRRIACTFQQNGNPTDPERCRLRLSINDNSCHTCFRALGPT